MATRQLPELPASTGLTDTDLLLTRQGSTDKSLTGAISKQNFGGIIPWEATFPFLEGAYTSQSQIVYRALQSSTNQDPAIDVAGPGLYWEIAFTNFVEAKSGRKNLIINGNFDIWQRGVSTTSSDAYLADRWEYTSDPDGGSTNSPSTARQVFSLGQTNVPGNPRYYSRIVGNISGGGGTESLVYRQKIESVLTGAGETRALSIYLKASSARTVNIDAVQFFGSGGSPSATVYTNIGQASLTTSWQKIELTVNIPSVSGKTLGSGGDDYLEVAIVQQAAAGSSYTTTSSSTASIDVSRCQFEPGNIPTDFEQLLISESLDLCQRYYISSYPDGFIPGSVFINNNPIFMADSLSGHIVGSLSFITRMRIKPTTAIYRPSTGTVNVVESVNETETRTVSTTEQSVYGMNLIALTSPPSAGRGYQFNYTADAEL